MKLKDYDYIIPIGYNCSCGMVLRNLKLRKQSFPLDWVISKPEWVLQYLKTNFKDYYLPNQGAKTNYIGQSFTWFETHRYSEHYAEKDEKNIDNNKSLYLDNLEKFDRRIKRLFEILNSDKKILFMYVGEYSINCTKNDAFEKNLTLNEEKNHEILHEILNYTRDNFNKSCELLTIYFKNCNSGTIKVTKENFLTRADIHYNLTNCVTDGQRNIISNIIEKINFDN